MCRVVMLLQLSTLSLALSLEFSLIVMMLLLLAIPVLASRNYVAITIFTLATLIIVAIVMKIVLNMFKMCIRMFF